MMPRSEAQQLGSTRSASWLLQSRLRLMKLASYAQLLGITAALVCACHAQNLKDIRGQGSDILRSVRKTVEKNYFDPEFGGVDMKAVFDKAENSMQQAQSAGHTFGIIAQALTALNDSHTFFIPPSRVNKVTYGWRMAMVGDRCLVTGVKPKTDAEAKGVKAGDEVVSIDGFPPSRASLWKMKLSYYSLQPRTAVKLRLRSPDGSERQLEVASAIKPGKQVIDLVGTNAENEYWEMIRESQTEASVDPHRTYNFGKDLIVYRMPDFSLDSVKIDSVMARLRKYDRVILDLRGNGGGAVSALERVGGYLLGKDVVLAERRGRKKEKPIVTQSAGDPIPGKLVVLVDSESASAAEILARAIQLEKRGTVIGDRTAGAVRQSSGYSLQVGQTRAVIFSVSVTNAEVIMKDGKRLEHVGVTPDELLPNTPAALAAGADLTLARAALRLGYELSPEDAGKIFPQKWLD